MTLAITSVLNETRVFPPPATFQRQAHIGSMPEYERMHKESIEKPEEFWGQLAKKH
jgi:acetyl-CoA synthetase